MITKNMAMGHSQTLNFRAKLETFCDRGIIFSFCVLIFVLPASIAILDSFAGVAILFYFIKKISRMSGEWPHKASGLNAWGKVRLIWGGFAPPENALNLPLQLLALAFLISVLFSQYPVFSLVAFFGKFVKCVFLYCSFIEAFTSPKRIKIFLAVFLVSGFIAALSGVVEHYTGRDFIKGHTFGYENSLVSPRVNSVFYTANGFGAYLVPVLALAMHLLFTFFRRRSWGWGIALAVVLTAFLACLCWTYSRSAWVGYALALVLMFGIDFPRKIIYTGLLALLFVFVFLPSLNSVRHLQLINDYNDQIAQQKPGNSLRSLMENAGSGRKAYWQKAVSIIRTSPVYGTGLNTYTRVLKQDPHIKVLWYAHNSYLQLAAETGLLGLSCFLFVCFRLLQQGFKRCRQLREEWSLTFLQGALTGFSGMMLQCFFDNTLFSVQLSVLFWVMMGLTMAAARLNPALEPIR